MTTGPIYIQGTPSTLPRFGAPGRSTAAGAQQSLPPTFPCSLDQLGPMHLANLGASAAGPGGYGGSSHQRSRSDAVPAMPRSLDEVTLEHFSLGRRSRRHIAAALTPAAATAPAGAAVACADTGKAAAVRSYDGQLGSGPQQSNVRTAAYQLQPAAANCAAEVRRSLELGGAARASPPDCSFDRS